MERRARKPHVLAKNSVVEASRCFERDRFEAGWFDKTRGVEDYSTAEGGGRKVRPFFLCLRLFTRVSLGSEDGAFERCRGAEAGGTKLYGFCKNGPVEFSPVVEDG